MHNTVEIKDISEWIKTLYILKLYIFLENIYMQ